MYFSKIIDKQLVSPHSNTSHKALSSHHFLELLYVKYNSSLYCKDCIKCNLTLMSQHFAAGQLRLHWGLHLNIKSKDFSQNFW